jgi:hypothetical protein
MKKLGRERAVPTISARVSRLIRGTTVRGTPSFSLELNSLVDQILFVTDIARQFASLLFSQTNLCRAMNTKD